MKWPAAHQMANNSHPWFYNTEKARNRKNSYFISAFSIKTRFFVVLKFVTWENSVGNCKPCLDGIKEIYMCQIKWIEALVYLEPCETTKRWCVLRKQLMAFSRSICNFPKNVFFSFFVCGKVCFSYFNLKKKTRK